MLLQNIVKRKKIRGHRAPIWEQLPQIEDAVPTSPKRRYRHSCRRIFESYRWRCSKQSQASMPNKISSQKRTYLSYLSMMTRWRSRTDNTAKLVAKVLSIGLALWMPQNCQAHQSASIRYQCMNDNFQLFQCTERKIHNIFASAVILSWLWVQKYSSPW
jgi:hypothetical protein